MAVILYAKRPDSVERFLIAVSQTFNSFNIYQQQVILKQLQAVADGYDSARPPILLPGGRKIECKDESPHAIQMRQEAVQLLEACKKEHAINCQQTKRQDLYETGFNANMAKRDQVLLSWNTTLLPSEKKVLLEQLNQNLQYAISLENISGIITDCRNSVYSDMPEIVFHSMATLKHIVCRYDLPPEQKKEVVDVFRFVLKNRLTGEVKMIAQEGLTLLGEVSRLQSICVFLKYIFGLGASNGHT